MNKLKEIRKKLGFTQEYVSKQSKISRPHISRIENGIAEPKMSTMQKIAKALNEREENIFFT